MNSREVHCGVMQWGGASGVFGVHHRLSAEGAGEAKKARELMKKLFEIIWISKQFRCGWPVVHVRRAKLLWPDSRPHGRAEFSSTTPKHFL